MTSPAQRRASERQFLEHEEIGVRHRMEHFYLPRFREFCRARGIPGQRVRVLDCGCGHGVSLECLAEAGYDAFGIDLTRVRRRQWSERPRRSRTYFCQADAVRLPFADSSFDIVFSCGLIEHIGVAEDVHPAYRVTPLPNQAELRRRFLADCLRVLRRPGVLYLDHPNGAFPIDFWHNHASRSGRPRFHRLSERFLPTFQEVAGLVRRMDPACRVQALSPANRFTFRRARRHWHGRLLATPMQLYFRLLSTSPFSRLAGTAWNPYLVIRITRQ